MPCVGWCHISAKMRKPGEVSISNHPRGTQIPSLQACLSYHGHWYCYAHKRCMNTAVGSKLNHGPYPYTYRSCSECGDRFLTPPRHTPLIPTQLRSAPRVPSVQHKLCSFPHLVSVGSVRAYQREASNRIPNEETPPESSLTRLPVSLYLHDSCPPRATHTPTRAPANM